MCVCVCVCVCVAGLGERSTLERLREQEAVLLEQLREAVSKKDAYKAELKELREMVKAVSNP
eukprot:COSAG05_NODE_20_length_33177_cov_336.302639_6_plen_62_part_00